MANKSANQKYGCLPIAL